MIILLKSRCPLLSRFTHTHAHNGHYYYHYDYHYYHQLHMNDENYRIIKLKTIINTRPFEAGSHYYYVTKLQP